MFVLSASYVHRLDAAGCGLGLRTEVWRLLGSDIRRAYDLNVVGRDLDTERAVEAGHEVAESGVAGLVVGNPAIGAEKRSIHAPILRTTSATWVSLVSGRAHRFTLEPEAREIADADRPGLGAAHERGGRARSCATALPLPRTRRPSVDEKSAFGYQ